jgi:hypothetical protein
LAVGVPLWLGLPAGLQDRVMALTFQGLVEKVERRFQSFGEHDDDSVQGRGYDRIWLHPEYVFVGAGEGAPGRLTSHGRDQELHSTWGTLLFSYGITGFLLFLVMLAVIFYRAPWRHMLYFLPIALYGLTHQGLRFSMLWVFFGLVFGVANGGRLASHRPAASRDRRSNSPPCGDVRQGSAAVGARSQRAFEV